MNQLDRFRGYEKGPIAVVIGPSMERHLRDVSDRFPKENVLRLLVKSLDRAHQRSAEQRKTEIGNAG